MHRIRVGLLAGVSALAIAAANPEIVQAADMPSRPALVTKAPPATPRDRWSWWVEGGASALAGDPGVAGLNGFDVDPNRWGWEAAVGFQYQQAMSPWIWSAQFRYSGFGSNSAANNPVAIFFPNNPPPTTTAIVGNNSASRKEHRWVADFMVGRDFGLGGENIARFGVRVAEIRGKTKGLASWTNIPGSAGIIGVSSCTAAPSYCGNEFRDYEQKNQFLGVGPRLQFDGSLPLGGRWSAEYMVGAAVLYGRRKVSQTVAVSHTIVPTFTPPAVFGSGGPIAANSSDNGFVFNADAMLGFSYAITDNASLMVSYRFDGYWNALRGYDSNGNVTNLDRFYHGPMIRLTIEN